MTARRLTESQAVPHFFLTSVVNVQRLLALRVEANEALAGIGKKVSINDMFVRACAVALRAHPEVNASWGDNTILRHAHINIGIAVAIAIDDGLIVPRRHRRRPQVTWHNRERNDRSRRPSTHRTADTKRNDRGNLHHQQPRNVRHRRFTAVINPPEAAILAESAATDIPVMRDGQLMTVP